MSYLSTFHSIDILSWNICSDCMKGNLDKRNAEFLARKCGESLKQEPRNNICLNNVVSLLKAKQYDVVGLQDASNWKLIFDDINRPQSLGYIHYAQHPSDPLNLPTESVVFYNRDKFQVLAIKNGRIKNTVEGSLENKTYSIIFLLNKIDHHSYIVIHFAEKFSSDDFTHLEKQLSENIDQAIIVAPDEVNFTYESQIPVQETDISDIIIKDKTFRVILMASLDFFYDADKESISDFYNGFYPFKYSHFPNLQNIKLFCQNAPPPTCCTGSRGIRSGNLNADHQMSDLILINGSDHFYLTKQMSIPSGLQNPSSDHLPVEVQVAFRREVPPHAAATPSTEVLTKLAEYVYDKVVTKNMSVQRILNRRNIVEDSFVHFNSNPFLIHYESFNGKAYPVIIIPKGTMLFTSRFHPTNTQVDSFKHLYKLHENATFTDYVDNIDNTLTYFFPVCMMTYVVSQHYITMDLVTTSKDIKLLALISPSPIGRSIRHEKVQKEVLNVETGKRANFGLDMYSCRTRGYDLCLNKDLILGLQLNGYIGIASQDGMHIHFKSINALMEGKLEDSLIHRACTYNNNYANWKKYDEKKKYENIKNNREYGIPEIVLIPFDIADPKNASKYDRIHSFMTNGKKKIMTEEIKKCFVFEPLHALSGKNTMEIIKNMVAFCNAKNTEILTSKQALHLLHFWKSKTDPKILIRFGISPQTPNIPLQDVCYPESYLLQRGECAFELVSFHKGIETFVKMNHDFIQEEINNEKKTTKRQHNDNDSNDDGKQNKRQRGNDDATANIINDVDSEEEEEEERKTRSRRGGRKETAKSLLLQRHTTRKAKKHTYVLPKKRIVHTISKKRHLLFPPVVGKQTKKFRIKPTSKRVKSQTSRGLGKAAEDHLSPSGRGLGKAAEDHLSPSGRGLVHDATTVDQSIWNAFMNESLFMGEALHMENEKNGFFYSESAGIPFLCYPNEETPSSR